VFNAVSLAYRMANADGAATCAPTSTTKNASSCVIGFPGLNGGTLSMDVSSRDLEFYYSVWDFNPADGLFKVVMETSAAASWSYVVSQSASHGLWPNGGASPAPDKCEFEICSTG
jgi:hypothetical protein